MTSSTVAGADGTDGTRQHVWHSIFGLCPFSQIEHFLKLRQKAVTHRRFVNGLIKLERNLWICDTADLLDEASQSGDTHAMYSQLGALTRYAKSKSSTQKVCRVSNADGIPTQSYSEEKLAFREHFPRLCLPKPSLMVRLPRRMGRIRTNLDVSIGILVFRAIFYIIESLVPLR